jgi:hypothetical protein
MENYSDFRRMVEIFNKRLDYEELISSSNFSMPKKNRTNLDRHKANWVIDKIKNLNGKNTKSDELISLCKEYIQLISYEKEELRLSL